MSDKKDKKTLTEDLELYIYNRIAESEENTKKRREEQNSTVDGIYRQSKHREGGENSERKRGSKKSKQCITKDE